MLCSTLSCKSFLLSLSSVFLCKPKRTVRESNQRGASETFSQEIPPARGFHFRETQSWMLLFSCATELCGSVFSPACALHALSCMSAEFLPAFHCPLQGFYTRKQRNTEAMVQTGIKLTFRMDFFKLLHSLSAL